MSAQTPNINEIKAIAEWMKLTNDIREISFKMGDVELSMSRNHGPAAALAEAPAAAPAPAAEPAPTPAPTPAPAAAPIEEAPAAAASEAGSGDSLAAGEVLIKAPMVGTFYSAPRPGAPDFVSAGDKVSEDTVLGIVEVMKLMNNLEAKVSGSVARILVENSQPVEYGQPLMVIKTDA